MNSYPRRIIWVSLVAHMLHNRDVCLSRSDFLHLFFSIVESYLTIYIWWDIFQCHYVTIDYLHHLVSMAIPRGTHLFWWRCSGRSDEMAGALVFRGKKTHPKHVFLGGYRDPIKVRTFFMFFLDLFIMFNRGGGGLTSIVTCTPYAYATAKRVKRVLKHC